MVDRQREGNELHEEFSVLGSTGNVGYVSALKLSFYNTVRKNYQVYTVIIDKTPTCNCKLNMYSMTSQANPPASGPDATKGNHCKHIVSPEDMPRGTRLTLLFSYSSFPKV